MAVGILAVKFSFFVTLENADPVYFGVLFAHLTQLHRIDWIPMEVTIYISDKKMELMLMLVMIVMLKKGLHLNQMLEITAMMLQNHTS